MTKPKTPGIDGAPKPPRSYSNAEKKDFRRLLAAYGPVSAANFDIFCDLVTTRGRIEVLRKMLADESADGAPDTETILKTNRQIDATTRLSMQLLNQLPSGVE